MREWPVVELDILHVGEVGREYRVGTYFNDGMVTAYTRDINPEWVGYEEYRVLAPSAAAAKKAAIKHRRARERKEGDRGE